MRPELRIANLAERQHGVFSRAQALVAGFTPDQIDSRVRRGLWTMAHRGIYRLPGAPLTFQGRALAAVFAGGRAVVVSHTAAAVLFEVEGISCDSIHISVPRSVRARIPGVVVHQSTNLRRNDVTRIGVIPVTSPERTLLDIAGMVRPTVLEDALDDLVRRRRTTSRTLLQLLDSANRRGHKGWGTLHELAAVRVGRPVSGSGRENRLRRLIHAAGLPDPVAQHEIRRPDGTFVARVDFAYPKALLAIEFDDYAHHSTRKQWERDRVRQNALVDLGWLPLRITEQQLRSDPEAVIGPILRRLTVSKTVNRRKKRRRGPEGPLLKPVRRPD
jgi:hypothetical protein